MDASRLKHGGVTARLDLSEGGRSMSPIRGRGVGRGKRERELFFVSSRVEKLKRTTRIVTYI